MTSGELKRIGILTDSISDLPDSIAKEHGIWVIPVKLHIDEKTYLDKVEITDEEFFRILVDGKAQTKTSQPSPYDFQVVFEKMLREFEVVIAIHASSELSGTFQSAQMALQSMGEDATRIHLFDTKQASMGEGLMVIRAAELARDGAEPKQIISELEKVAANIRTRFVPDTLTYLQRGGRIGKASAFLGNILNIKPLLGVDKVVYPVEKIRGSRNVVPKLVEQLKSDLKPQDKFRACILNLNMDEDASELQKSVEADEGFRGLVHAKVGATIGCHIGPKAIGLIWYRL